MSELQEAVDRGKSFADLIENYTFPESVPVEHDYDVVQQYEKLKSELGHTPQRKDFDAQTLNHIRRHYGNLSNLIKSVGDSPYSRRPSDEDLKREYKRVRDLIGRTPTLQDMSSHSPFTEKQFFYGTRRFTQLQRECGDRPNSEPGVSKDELIAAFEALRRTLGRVPKVNELDKQGEYRASLYRKRWGSMDKFREEMNIPKRSLGVNSYPKEELLLRFMLLNKTLQIQKGDANFQIEYMALKSMKLGKQMLLPGSTLRRKFGSWRAFEQALSAKMCSEFSQALDRLVEEFLKKP